MVYNDQIAIKNELFIKNFTDVLEMKKVPSLKKKYGQINEPQRKTKSIHRANQKLYSLIDNSWVTQIESNQLASNHPIEDRLRVSTLNLDSIFDLPETSSSTINDQCIGFGVFDGHNGGLCADIISRRLFHYIAVALKVFELRKNNVNTLPPIFSDLLQQISTDHCKSPSIFYFNINRMYEEHNADRLKSRIEDYEQNSLEKFAFDEFNRSYTEQTDTEMITAAINRAFVQCDQDLSKEIETNLLDTSSNILLHYYLSLAVSGCCSTVGILYENQLYIASTGDCRAVMGVYMSSTTVSPTTNEPLTKNSVHTIELSKDHNSDNIDELNRLMSEHPKNEHNNIIREHRLLGQLMPLRAFGDFSFKWSAQKMKELGLTRAFGSRIIPTPYSTPPYLTAQPEIYSLNLEDAMNDPEHELLDRFIILATDGLWEQFESSRKIVHAVNRYRKKISKQVIAHTSAQVFNIEPPPEGNPKCALKLGEIIDRLREKIKKPSPSKFERVTADDDLLEDINCGTFLLRTALSDISPPSITDQSIDRNETDEERFSHHVDQYVQQKNRHAKLVSYLTLPQSVVRNFRDDISLIVIGLKSVNT